MALESIDGGRRLLSQKDKLYIVGKTLFFPGNEGAYRNSLKNNTLSVFVAHFIQVDEGNRDNRTKRFDTNETFIERRFADRIHELGVIAAENIEAYYVGPWNGYSTTGYLVTAQGYREARPGKIN